MRTYLTLILFLLTGSVRSQGHPASQGFDKRAFYHDFSSVDASSMDLQLEALAAASFPGKEAFEGAMLMRRAGMEKDAMRRMDRFREGKQKLERVISKDSSNVEYRFLRLAIQEHVPKIVPYRNDVDRDAAIVLAGFDALSVEAKEAVRRYAKTSARLKAVTE